jgi:hypothetical protein
VSAQDVFKKIRQNAPQVNPALSAEQPLKIGRFGVTVRK